MHCATGSPGQGTRIRVSTRNRRLTTKAELEQQRERTPATSVMGSRTSSWTIPDRPNGSSAAMKKGTAKRLFSNLREVQQAADVLSVLEPAEIEAAVTLSGSRGLLALKDEDMPGTLRKVQELIRLVKKA